MKMIITFFICCVFLLALFISSGYAQVKEESFQPQKENFYPCEEDLIEIMFVENSRVRLRDGELIDLISDATAGLNNVLGKLAWFTWYRISEVPEEEMDRWAENGKRNTAKEIYNLNNIYRLHIPEELDVWSISKELENLPGIYLARPVPLPVEPPNPPDYQAYQGYLYPASNTPSGINALCAWNYSGGTGSGITICDIEYSWNYNHADISKAAGSSLNSWTDPGYGNDHGTAVIGELVADNNSWGTIGICYGANLMTCGSYYGTPLSWNVPGAIILAISNMSAGDIILLEQQWDYSNGGGAYIPIEWWLNYSPSAQTYNAVYAAIVNAVSNGIHVVEAGGNGNIDTDLLTWYGNSGAIIVGAGGAYSGGTWPNGDLQKLSFSSYGSRFDLQGWGENVYTTGYGDLYNAQGANYFYTSSFSGTSSASPIVAGALACAEGYYLANISSTPPSPAYMRNLLVTYGTPQVTPPSGNIGPRPDLATVIASFKDWGDALDPPHPTLASSSGAYHPITSLYMGVCIDAESDGQQSLNADGDDLNGLDDEDGVIFLGTLNPGNNVNVQVTTTGAGFLNAWIDFNMINSWSDPGEQIFINQFLNVGLNNLSFTVPASALPGPTYARFRFSSAQGVPFFGGAPDGEVEDYLVFIEEPQEDFDFGDAPDPNYPTLLANNGAHHYMDGITFLGVQIDTEPDGQPNAAATGDDNNILYAGLPDDEDGVIFTCPLIPGQQGAITVTTNSIVPAYLNGWIDFNADGDWQDVGEHILPDVILNPGIHQLNFSVPINAVLSSTYARFRLSTVAGISYTGFASDGEIEDYKIDIIEIPDDDCKMHYHQWPDTTWAGIDVRATEPIILADDFLCIESGLINSIHIWGSWKWDEYLMPDFNLTIWSDNPCGPEGYSQPKNELWSGFFTSGQYTDSIYYSSLDGEYWYDPLTLELTPNADYNIWQYDFIIPDSLAFEQVQDSIYWLAIQVLNVPEPMGFGWKTSVNHWNDDAVWGTDGVFWNEFIYPDGHPYHPESIDFSFYINCSPTPPIVDIAVSSDTVCVTWNPVPCANSYKIFSSTDPYSSFPSAWTLEQTGITATSWCEDASGIAKKFYRVIAVK